jgi:hypothetical protein
MPKPLLPIGFLSRQATAKGVQEARQAIDKNQYKRAYFDGLSGLSADAREAWEKQYLNEISGLSDADKDEVFRNTVFKDLFKNSDNPQDQEIWNNRKSISLADRDIYVARKAVEQDVDEISNAKEQEINLVNGLFSPEAAKEGGKAFAAKVKHSLRDSAMDYLAGVSEDVASAYRSQVNAMDTPEKETLANNFDTLSRDAFPNYKEYIGTDKLDLSSDELAELAANYSAWQNVGGDNFAYRMLYNTYKDIIGKNQSVWEKGVNTGAQFVDSAAGMIIRGVGMAGGLVGIGLEDDEKWFDNFLDNAVTRYGDRVATTQSWNAARQEYLEENGLQDNPILGTSKQENAILSWNTPFEVLGQYGFTAASTLLSFGGSGLVQAGTKGLSALGKVATGAKGLNTTAKGIALAKGVIKARDIGNFLVAAGLGTIEGGMNAVGTRDKVLKDLNGDIDRDINTAIDNSITSFVQQHPNEALQLLAQTGVEIPEDVTADDIISVFKEDAGVREYFGNQISGQFDERRAQAEEDARKAMTIDFIGNSIINGFINTTLQATLNAPSIQRSLRKVGIQKSPLDDMGVIVKKGNTGWNASAKKFTKWEGVKNRFKEAWGEGVEEYTQDLSGAFGEGYAKDRMSQYIDWKYGDSDGADAFEEDVFRNFLTGLEYMGEAATSQQSIKDGLYGILSTAVGGLNINPNNRGSKERKEGESTLSYIKRRNLLTWRSALGPLFNSSDVEEVNEQRDKTAQMINDFFSDSEKQNTFFNLEASTNWMRQAQKALQSRDEKALRDAKIGELVSNIFAVNELRGSAYYDAIMASLNARANFDVNNLNDPDSIESKTADQYLADVRNRGEDMSREEALEQVIKASKDMLSMMDSVDSERAKVEKLFGSEIDRDTKEALVFARVSANDAKSRIDTIDKELSQVKAALEQQENNSESSGLSRRSRRIIARFGSLGEAQKSFNEMVKEREGLSDYISEFEDEIKSDSSVNYAVNEDRESRREGRIRINAEKQLLRQDKKSLRELDRTIDDARRDIERYKREAPRETKVTTDGDGNEVTSEILSGREVLTAREIMNLDSVDRAYMLNPKNRDKYSQAQQDEIEKVEIAGNKLFNDFTTKVVDRGRLESDYNGITRNILRMTQDPMLFAKYQQDAKNSKQRRLLNKKYQYLKDYDGNRSYAEFAAELTRINEEEPQADREAAVRVLKNSNSAYFARYNESEKVLENVLGKLSRNEAYNKLSDNEKSLFVNTLDYLVGKGVDIDNINEVIDAISAVETVPETGATRSPFADYIAETNARVKDEKDKTQFTSADDAIQIFKDVMGSIRREQEEQINNNRPVDVQPTTPEQSAPVQAPQPKEPGIFSQAYSSPEGGRPEGSDDVEMPAATQETKSPSVIETFKESSGDIVAKAAEVAITTAKNTPSHVANSDAIDIAVNKIESLKDNFFESAEDLADEILKEANLLDQTGEAKNQAAAGVLRRASDAAKNQSRLQTQSTRQEESNQQTQSETPLTGLAARRYNFARNFTNMVEGGNPTTNSAVVSTLNIQNIKTKYPDSPTTKFLEEYKVEEFLSDPEALTGDRRTIKFITDSKLTADVKASMEQANVPYTTAALPVIPVVEVKDNNGHVFVINEDGVEHYYQPIGILPATYNSYVSGANRLGKLRELAESQPENTIIKDENGNTISTTVVGHVTATPPRHLDENQSVIHIGMKSPTKAEQDELKGKSKEEARQTDAYKKLRDSFLSRLIAIDEGSGSTLYYSSSNLKNDGNFSGFIVTRTPIHKTAARNSKENIIDIFRAGRVAEALSANTRIDNFSYHMKDIFAKNSIGNNLFIPDRNGGLKLSEDGTKAIKSFLSSLERSLSNYILLPKGFTYSLTPSYIDSPSEGKVLKKSPNGSPVFILSATDGTTNIPLSEVGDGIVNDQVVFDTLYNLFLDSSGQPRMRSAKESFAIWQIEHAKLERMKRDERDRKDIINIYDDGILEASVESFEYSVNSVQFNAPFTMEGKPRYELSTIANPENAGTQTTGTAQTPDGATVDVESGIQVESPQDTSTPPSTPISPAAKTAAEIVEASKHITLSEDGTSYVDSRTGKSYARVTSIIYADRESTGDRMDPNDPYVLPSTNIGTGIDELVRDFFGNSLKDLDSYPNTDKAQVEAFIEQLKGLKAELTAAGLTIIPRDVVVTGALNATDAKGNVHQIDVAGTLDLLAYDAEGNFYIFDMKTFKTSINSEKQKKYARQLSLYKKFLEDNYGVKVKALKIIPIKVEYPKPSQVTYGLAEGKPNQLTSNGKEYRSIKPKLYRTITLDYHEPNIDFDRLTDAEKAMFLGAQEEQEGTPMEVGEKTTIAPAPPSTTPVDPFTGMPMAGYVNPLTGKSSGTMAGQGASFDVSNLRWGVWTGLTKEQKAELKEGLEAKGYTKEIWENTDDTIRPSDEEKKHEIECILGL